MITNQQLYGTGSVRRSPLLDFMEEHYEIAALLDPAMRSAIYRNFKLGMKLGKIPEWMGKTANDFVKGEGMLSIDPLAPASKDVNDY